MAYLPRNKDKRRNLFNLLTLSFRARSTFRLFTLFTASYFAFFSIFNVPSAKAAIPTEDLVAATYNGIKTAISESEAIQTALEFAEVVGILLSVIEVIQLMILHGQRLFQDGILTNEQEALALIESMRDVVYETAQKISYDPMAVDQQFMELYPSAETLTSTTPQSINTLKEGWAEETEVTLKDALRTQAQLVEDKEDLIRQLQIVMSWMDLSDQGPLMDILTAFGVGGDKAAAYQEIAGNTRGTADLLLIVVQQMEQIHALVISQFRAISKYMAQRISEAQIQDVSHATNMTNFANYTPETQMVDPFLNSY